VVEPLEDPFGPKVRPILLVHSVTHFSGPALMEEGLRTELRNPRSPASVAGDIRDKLSRYFVERKKVEISFAKAKQVVEIAWVLTVNHRPNFSCKHFLDSQNGELALRFIADWRRLT